MKATITAFIACALALATIGRADETSSKNDNNDQVSIQFLEPENYTDFAKSQMKSKSGREALEKEFRQRLKDVAGRYLPPGYHLTLRFRDINMAGEFEPQRGPEFNDVRIIRGIYPPSIKVEYEIKDPEGNVVASGQRRETDLTFQDVVTFRRDRPLFYETELVIDLLRDITRSL